jgi:hypothetical protein
MIVRVKYKSGLEKIFTVSEEITAIEFVRLAAAYGEASEMRFL